MCCKISSLSYHSCGVWLRKICSVLFTEACVCSCQFNNGSYCKKPWYLISGEDLRPDLVKEMKSFCCLWAWFWNEHSKELREKRRKVSHLLQSLSKIGNVSFMNLSMGSSGSCGQQPKERDELFRRNRVKPRRMNSCYVLCSSMFVYDAHIIYSVAGTRRGKTLILCTGSSCELILSCLHAEICISYITDM